MHKLYYIRTSVGLTQGELSELSGVAKVTIDAIESQRKAGRINYTTAHLLEEALYMDGMIFCAHELTSLGRPAATGHPIRDAEPQCESFEVLCLNCNLYGRKQDDGACIHCGRDMELSRDFFSILTPPRSLAV